MEKGIERDSCEGFVWKFSHKLYFKLWNLRIFRNKMVRHNFQTAPIKIFSHKNFFLPILINLCFEIFLRNFLIIKWEVALSRNSQIDLCFLYLRAHAIRRQIVICKLKEKFFLQVLFIEKRGKLSSDFIQRLIEKFLLLHNLRDF